MNTGTRTRGLKIIIQSYHSMTHKNMYQTSTFYTCIARLTNDFLGPEDTGELI
jgi:hypothetical protein